MRDHRGWDRRLVSQDSEELILVDSSDREIGYLAKGACHDGEGIRHRAFSLFVFDGDGQVLIQQRAPQKRLWPGYWANACCSHPRRGESAREAVARRAQEELGLRIDRVGYVYRFEYHARYGDLGAEHELCHVYLGIARAAPQPHPEEISDWCWLAPSAVDAALAASPSQFAPWFRSEWKSLRSDYGQTLSRYTREEPADSARQATQR